MKKATLMAGVIFVALGVIAWGVDELGNRVRRDLREAARAGDMARTADLLRWSRLYDLRLGGAFRGPVQNGHAEVVALLMEAGGKPDWTELTYAAEAGHTEVVALLIDSGVDLTNWSALAAAVREGHTEVIDLLIQSGAAINQCGTSYNGVDGVSAAIGNALSTIVGSPQRMSARGHTGPLHPEGCYPLALREAIQRGHTEIAATLIDAGSNVMARTHLYSPVELARESGDPDMIRLLESALELPLPGNVINAAEARDWDRMSRLVALGTDVNEPENWSSGRNYGRTALMYAAVDGRADMVRMLLGAGADVSMTTPQDSATALSLAIREGHDDVAELLRAAGAQG